MTDETAGGHEENNIASEIDLSNFVVLNEKASTRLMDSWKSFLDISGASSSIAVDIDWCMEYALGSDHLSIVLSIACDLITTRPQRTVINFRKADWANFENDSELKLELKQH